MPRQEKIKLAAKTSFWSSLRKDHPIVISLMVAPSMNQSIRLMIMGALNMVKSEMRMKAPRR